MQSSKEQQGEIRKPSSLISAKEYGGKIIEWEKLEISSKIRDNKGKIHAKMGSIKDRNCIDLTEAGDIKKCQDYTEELYKKRSL